MSDWSRENDHNDSSTEIKSLLKPCTVVVDQRSTSPRGEHKHGRWPDHEHGRRHRLSASSSTPRHHDGERTMLGAASRSMPLHRTADSGSVVAPAAKRMRAASNTPPSGGGPGQQDYRPRTAADTSRRREEGAPYRARSREDTAHADPRIHSRRDRASPPIQVQASKRLSVTLPSDPPTDPRRRRPRPSPRAGGGSGSVKSPAVASPSRRSPPMRSSSPPEVACSGARRSASASASPNGGVVGAAGIGPERVARPSVPEKNPWAAADPNRTKDGSVPVEERQAVARGQGGGERETESRRVNGELGPADARFPRRPSLERACSGDDRSSSSNSNNNSLEGNRVRPPGGIEHDRVRQRRRRIESTDSPRWAEEPSGSDCRHSAPLAVSIGEVILGGRGAAGPLPPRGGRVPPHGRQDYDPHRRQQQFPPARGGGAPHHPLANNADPDFDHGNSVSPPRRFRPPPGHLPPRGPWPSRQHSRDRPFQGDGGSYGDGGEPHHHLELPVNGPSSVHATPPVPLPNDGGQQRRSAYAQAMRNKRSMGPSMPEVAAHPRQGFVSMGGRGHHPPMMMPPRGDPCPPYSQHGFQANHPPFGPEPRPGPGPPRGYWGDGGFEADFFPGIGGGGAQPWGQFGGDIEEDEEGFPLVHTSPEWTPAQAGRGVNLQNSRPEDDEAQEDGAQMSPISENGDGGGGGETRAESIQQRGERAAGKGLEAVAAAITQTAAVEESGNGANPKTTSRAASEAEDKEGAVSAADAASAVSTATATVGAPAAAAVAVSCSGGSSPKTPLPREQRLEPSPLTKVMWNVGDLEDRFPG